MLQKYDMFVVNRFLPVVVVILRCLLHTKKYGPQDCSTLYPILYPMRYTGLFHKQNTERIYN